MIGKDVEWKAERANIVPTVFEQKFAFESFWPHFWENGYLYQTIMINLIGKDVEWLTKPANTF